MMSVLLNHQTLVPPPSSQRAQAKQQKALHIDALTLVTCLHLLTLCRLAVRLAHHRCPPPLPRSVQVVHLDGTARKAYYLQHSSKPFGGFRIKI
jgi:hypothetical protein